MGAATILTQSTEGLNCLCRPTLDPQRWNLEIDEGRATLRCQYCYKRANDAIVGALQMAPIAVQLIDLDDTDDLIVRVRGQHA